MNLKSAHFNQDVFKQLRTLCNVKLKQTNKQKTLKYILNHVLIFCCALKYTYFNVLSNILKHM